MNDDSQYYPKQNNAENERHPDAEPFAHRFPDADAESSSEISTPFAPEDAPVATRQNPLTRQYQPDTGMPDTDGPDTDMPDPYRSDMEASAAYAFGATDAAEGENLRRQIQTDARLAREVEEFRALHRAMHYTAPPVAPPVGLAARLRAATQPEDAARAASTVRRSAPAPIFTVPQPTLVRSSAAMPSAEVRRPAAMQRPAASRINPLTGKPIARSTPVAPVPATSRFAAKPADAAQKATQQLVADVPRTGIFAANTRFAWSGALVALILFAGASYLWFDQAQMNSRTLTETASLQTRSRELESELASAQQDLLASRQAYDNAQATLTHAQETLATAQAELSGAQSALTGSQEQLSAMQAQLGEQLDLQATLVALLAETQMETISLAATNAANGITATARIVWQPETNAGMLVTMEMPPLLEDQVYQLWYLRGGVPYSAGMFTVDASGKGMLELDSMAIADYEVAAITPEPMGGSPAPTGPILIVGEL